MALLCENCLHWQPTDRLSCYAAPCALGCFPGRVPFDLTCDEHSGREVPPPVQDQSQVRGVPTMVTMYGPRGTP